MARIPTLADSPNRDRISTQVPRMPTQDPRQAAQGFNQAAQIAGGVADMAFQIAQKQQNEADNAALNKASIDATTISNDILRNTEQEYRSSNPTFDGYREDALKRFDKQSKEMLKTVPKSVRDKVKMSLAQKRLAVEQKAYKTEYSNKSQYALNTDNDILNSASESAYAGYDLESTKNNIDKLKNRIDSSELYDNSVKAGMKSKLSEIPKSMLNGVLDRSDPSELNLVLDDLTDKDISSKVFGEIKPKERSSFIDRIERKLEKVKRESQIKIDRQFKQLSGSLKSGAVNPNDPQVSAMIETAKRNIINTFEGDEAAQRVAELDLDTKLASTYREEAFNRDFNPEQLAKEITDGIEDPYLKQYANTNALIKTAKRKKEMDEEFRKDGPGYITKYDTSVAAKGLQALSGDRDSFDEYKIAIDERYDEMGVPTQGRKYISPQMNEHFANNIKTFMENNDTKSANAVIDDFISMVGPESYRLQHELKVDKEHKILLNISDSNARQQLMDDMVSFKDAIEPAYKVHPNVQTDQEVTEELVLDPMYQSFSQMMGGEAALDSPNSRAASVALSNANAMLDAAKVRYKKLIVSGRSPEEAREGAFDVFRADYDIVEGSRNEMIPVKKGVNNASNIQSFMDKYTSANISPQGIQELGITSSQNRDLSEITQTVRDQGKWVYDLGSNSLTLTAVGGLKKNSAFMGPDGKPITIRLEDIDNMEFTEDSPAQRNIKNLFAEGVTTFGKQ